MQEARHARDRKDENSPGVRWLSGSMTQPPYRKDCDPVLQPTNMAENPHAAYPLSPLACPL